MADSYPNSFSSVVGLIIDRLQSQKGDARRRKRWQTLQDDNSFSEPVVKIVNELLESQFVWAESAQKEDELAFKGGDLIDGYLVHERLGQGGGGQVYRASSDSGEVVAIKVPRYTQALELARKCFELEADHLRAIDGRFVIEGRGSGVATIGSEENRVPYLTMKFVEGALPIDQASGKIADLEGKIELMEQVCLGVMECHHAQRIHSDLKPANLLVDSKGQVFVIDLGLASRLSLVDREARGGSIWYMAPEQLGDDSSPVELNKTLDIYTLGVIFFEMVAEQLPFRYRGKDGISIRDVIRAQPRISLGAIKGKAPRRLQRLFAQMLALNPKDRPENVKLILRELQQIKAQWISQKEPGRFGWGEILDRRLFGVWLVSSVGMGAFGFWLNRFLSKQEVLDRVPLNRSFDSNGQGSGTSFNGSVYYQAETQEEHEIYDELTVCAWVKTRKGGTVVSKSQNRFLGTSWIMGVEPNNGGLWVLVSQDGSWNKRKTYYSKYSVRNDGWRMLAFTFRAGARPNEDGELKLYVDSVEVSGGDLEMERDFEVPRILPTPEVPVMIGARLDAENQIMESFEGDIDEVSIWSKTFELDQIREINALNRGFRSYLESHSCGKVFSFLVANGG